MSNNPNHGPASGSEPPRPQVKYNLAALRLAQSSNNDQGSQIHFVSGAPTHATAIAPPTAVSPVTEAGSGSLSNVLSFAVVAGGAITPRKGLSTATTTTSSMPPATVPTGSASATAALLAAIRIGGKEHNTTAAGTKADPSPPSPTTTGSAKYTVNTTSLTSTLTSPPVPRSAQLSSVPSTAAMPPVHSVASPSTAQVPMVFSTTVPLPARTTPLTQPPPQRLPVPPPQQLQTPSQPGNSGAVSSASVAGSDSSRRPAMMSTPQQQARSLQSQQFPQTRQQRPQQQLTPAAVPVPPGAPRIPQPRGVHTGSAFVNSFQQASPMPQHPLQQQRKQLSPPDPSASRSIPNRPPVQPQPQRPFLLPYQQQQQFFPQQLQSYQAQPPLPATSAGSAFVPAPRTQRDARTIPGFTSDGGFSPPPSTQQSSLLMGQNMPVHNAAPAPPSAAPMEPQQHQQQHSQQPRPLPLSQQPPTQQLSFQVPRPISGTGASRQPVGPPSDTPTMALPTAPPVAQSTPAATVPFAAPNSKNLYNQVPQVASQVPPPPPRSFAQSSPVSHVVNGRQGTPSPQLVATSTPPVLTNAAGADAATAPKLDIQQVSPLTGISAHGMATPPSTTFTAAGAAAAPATLPASMSGTSAAVSPQLTQLTQRQEQQRVPLNFYSTAAGAASLHRPQRQQQQDGFGQRNGRGGNRQHFDPLQQQKQYRFGRDTGGLLGYSQNGRAPPAPPPVSHLTAPDPETLKRFKGEYAQQEDAEGISDALKAQQATKLGTVGTLDKEVCLSLIETHDVTFVITDTGTGKSTCIPIALHKAHPDALIVNAQPRRTATINLARRVAELLDVKLGEEVGYSVRGEHIGDLGSTKVMYVTTYSLFIYFLWHEFKEKLPFTYIVVDEFHERTPDIEVILLMLKLWLKKNPKAFKLILCSATAQVEEWYSFFEGLSVGTYSSSSIMYPVREYFIEDLQKLVGFRTAPIVPQDSSNMVTSEQMHQLIFVCKQLLVYLAKNTATQDSVLVFMPGRTQVELMTTWMRDNLEESVEPVAWYRDVELSVIQEALARSPVTRKKVYVATDIAEVSLTLPDVVFVIDSGTGKRPQVSAKEPTSYAFPPLRLLWETASNAQQRRGRVGRVQQGFYFSLLSQDHYNALRETENRIKNAVLTELVLHSLLITQKPFAFFQLCGEKPETGALSYSLHFLQDGGLIISKDDPLAESERVALDRPRTTHVMDSPWNELVEEALGAAPVTASTPAAGTAETKEKTCGEDTETNVTEAGTDKKRGDGKVDDGTNDDTNSVDDDGDEVCIPEAEDEAFQKCYYMTLRGVIAARSPVSVAAATNIFYGLLCGTPTLSMLAAAIESSKTPFHVPYTINDRVERAGMVRTVSQMMQRYHGSLKSDLICAMEVILEYMSMQRDGLSEEAQEVWCRERNISRTRVVDTLNLFAQMKEQVSSVLPFLDVTDIDLLTAQFNESAELLVLMLVASHTELAIQVQLDGPVAQKRGFVGHGMFFPLKCLKDESVPTVCPWDRTKISVPLSLQTIQRKVLAVFSSQVEPDLFALVVLVFSFKLRYTVLDRDAVPSYLMSVSHSGVRRVFQCDVLTAQQILQLRRIQCAQLRCMQLRVEERVKENESEKLSALLKSANSDFGLPDSAIQMPYLIPTVFQHGLKLLVSRLRSSPSFAALKQPITGFPKGTAYCKLQHTAELSAPILQSVLIHSSNGLSVVQPAAMLPVVAASSAESRDVEAPATGAAATASPSTETVAGAVEAEETVSKSEEDEDDEVSERSSDSGSGEHVATFCYDL